MFDLPDVADIVAPRPMFFVDGEQDRLPPKLPGGHDRMHAGLSSRRIGERLRTQAWPRLGRAFADPRQDAVLAWPDSVL